MVAFVINLIVALSPRLIISAMEAISEEGVDNGCKEQVSFPMEQDV